MTAFLQYIDWRRLRKSVDSALLKLAALALATLVLGHSLGVASWELAGHSLSGTWRFIIGFLAFIAAAAWLRVHRFRHRGNLAAFATALAAGHWIALDFHHALEHLHLTAGQVVLVALAGFFVCRVFHHHVRDSWKNWVTLAREPSSERVRRHLVKHLVIFLSPPTSVPREEEGGRLSFANEKTKGDWLPTTGVIDADIQTMGGNGFHNWLQPLRGIQPHAGALKSLWIIVSKPGVAGAVEPAKPGEKASNMHGSALYGALAGRWLGSYLPGCEVKISAPHDFEDFKSMLQYVRKEILGTLHPRSRHELAIDITGGMKITSVLGAFLTANDQTVFQYVPTVASGGNVPAAQIYDIRHDVGPDIPG